MNGIISDASVTKYMMEFDDWSWVRYTYGYVTKSQSLHVAIVILRRKALNILSLLIEKYRQILKNLKNLGSIVNL